MSPPGTQTQTPDAKSELQAQRAEETELLQRIARGDQAALGVLYDRYSPVLMAIGCRVLGNREAAEDLLHDVFLEAWRRAADYDPTRGSVRVWLCMRMRSRSLDRIRSSGRRQTVPMEEANLPEAEQGSDGDPSLTADRVTVRRALEALPPEQRAVLELGYFEGLSSTEIAERVGIPVGTVKSRVASGIAKLRLALADPDQGDSKGGGS